jgi:hypothetical protein
MPEKNIVYFDLETQRLASDVGGWAHMDKMGLSIGVTYSTAASAYRIYGESEASALADELRAADLVVGFNHIRFDLAVLQPYTMWDLPSQTVNLDLLVELEAALGHRLKLESVASASLGVGKTADGLEAIRWWREGKVYEIAKYCAYDVKVTKAVHEYGRTHGFVKYHDRFGRPQQVAVQW